MAQQSSAEPDEKAPKSKEQSTRQTNSSATERKHSPVKAAGPYTRVVQHEAGHRGLHPVVVHVEDSAQLLQRAEGISLESGCGQHTVRLGLSALAEPVEMSCRGHDTQ